MVSITVENYLKAILALQDEVGPRAPVSTGALARALGVVPGTATAMVKHLAGRKLVRHIPRVGVRLTAKGERQALAILRRHRLIETFLVQTLGLDWTAVHEEAERLEHALSDRVLERIDALLGHPRTDPHGDPIPAAEALSAPAPGGLESLATCAPGAELRVARITDQDEDFLRFVEKAGLKPGEAVEVRGRDEAAEATRLRVGGSGKALTLGAGAAGKILVEPVGD